jgi:uncharacterized protein
MIEAKRPMTENIFVRYELRTSDPEVGRAFYTEVFGAEFWNSGAVRTARLPERAAAAGAPPHWLGHIGVKDVEQTVSRITALGAERLGPVQIGADGSCRAILRDPFGAVLALCSANVDSCETAVAWHLHHSKDHESSFAWYARFFGWNRGEVIDLGPRQGSHRMFTWEESGKIAGSMADTARLPGIHAQWLFFFPVSEIQASLAKVRALGGGTLEPMQTAHHDWVAPCNDLQGAAFALYQFQPLIRPLLA